MRTLPTFSATEIWIIVGNCHSLGDLAEVEDFMRDEIERYCAESQIQICRRLMNQRRLLLASGPNHYLYP